MVYSFLNRGQIMQTSATKKTIRVQRISPKVRKRYKKKLLSQKRTKKSFINPSIEIVAAPIVEALASDLTKVLQPDSEENASDDSSDSGTGTDSGGGRAKTPDPPDRWDINHPPPMLRRY